MSPDLVLLHGASGHSATWDLLRPEWRWASARSPDLPGRGATPGPARDRVPALAGWLADRLRAQGAPPIVLGHSLGGAIGLQLALDHPDALRALVLVSSASRLRVHPLILEAVASSTPDAPYRLDLAFGPETPMETKDAYAVACATTPPETALADWQACDHFDVRARLGEVQVPALVIHGSEDTLTAPRFQSKLAEALPCATRVEIPGAGHMLPWEAPAQLAEAVRRWVEGL